MAIFGVTTDRHNPEFTKEDFVFWMPSLYNFFYKKNAETGEVEETEIGIRYWNKLYKIVNDKVYHSIFGTDWELAMSLVIAHYLILIALQAQTPAGSELADIANGSQNTGVMSSGSVGGFSISYDIDKTISSDKEAQWWNLTKWGSQFYALMQTKSVSTIFVVTSDEIPEEAPRTWTCPECGCAGIKTGTCPICGNTRFITRIPDLPNDAYLRQLILQADMGRVEWDELKVLK